MSHNTLPGEQFPQQLSPSNRFRISREVFQKVSKRFCQQNGKLPAALGGRPPTGLEGWQRDLSRRLPRQLGRLRSRGGPASPIAPLTAPGEAAAPPSTGGAGCRRAPSHLLRRPRRAPAGCLRPAHQVLGVLEHVGHAAAVLLVEEEHVAHPQQRQRRQRPVEERRRRGQPPARPPHRAEVRSGLAPRPRARRGGTGRGGTGRAPQPGRQRQRQRCGRHVGEVGARRAACPPCWGGQRRARPP